VTRSVLLFAVALVWTSGAAHAERLTIAVSSPEVRITSNFAGSPVTVFGVIDDVASTAARPGGYEMAVMILGPNERVVARRKDRVLAIWANRDARAIGGAPSFYGLSTSAPLDTVASPNAMQRLQIGFQNIRFVIDGRSSGLDEGAIEFRDAFIRLRQQERLYTEATSVEFIGDRIFRSTVFLPANIRVGRYTVVAYLFSEGELLAHAQERFDVSKAGIDGSIAAFARNQSLLYGILCAGLALFVGWAGGVIFRRD
jgi:uncharacterized protein (TIGR02186 family)